MLMKTGMLYFTTCFHGFGILRHVDPFVRMLHICVMWFQVYDTSRIISHCGCTTNLISIISMAMLLMLTQPLSLVLLVLFTLILTSVSNVHLIDTGLTPWPMLKHIYDLASLFMVD